ncbi:MAG: GDP-mannose 4,6-dehydratase [Desulfohalobiaceae bacterium]|nr:GDP-mannose 4,6-dehydratase [Desulfohalobiaceae bacterium]
MAELQDKDKAFVVQHPLFYRPAEVDLLIGNSQKARSLLKWEPKVRFPDLVRMMVQADIQGQ